VKDCSARTDPHQTHGAHHRGASLCGDCGKTPIIVAKRAINPKLTMRIEDCINWDDAI
jgi:hypothetical protein